ncbi:hypothetical protein BAUCODRAFT_123454 [Baudoinia panamericana UAMH 10762]|uniref:HbrB-like protein n=1 Tax=Baudoinia panamericana (strain UAMH 10762) TaxID=717646 RepID=M2MEG6_BAUPA|nr:uncharacterized protein BAUCODRAFT_123454 [Baudoinia panamericana UAMH 10762]EMC94966.1 hypothetical protein BAUCODRAFT_123454 [Baudoinia panamericana UAMH 10762]
MTQAKQCQCQRFGARPSTAGGPTPSQSTSSLALHQQNIRTSVDAPLRNVSPSMSGASIGHRARQRSQGFFEPSLPHTTSNSTGLSASTIAAQTAMHHMSPPPMHGWERKRSHPGLAPINTGGDASRRSSNTQSPQVYSAGGLPYSNGTVGGNKLAAATAANVAFPNGRSPLPSPNSIAPQSSPPPISTPDKEPKAKSSKMKLFSKPKSLSLAKDKEGKVPAGAPSPGKGSITASLLRNGFASASTTSLVDPTSGAGSIYSSANASTSTLVPLTTLDKEKEKRPHFLSRQKHKLKDEPAQLPLSSAHSNSQPTNPEKPQPLYSFTPDSPGPGSFTKSMSGFDLRHGARALREKKKEEKAAAAAAKLDLAPSVTNTSTTGQSDQYLGPSQYDNNFGPPSVSASVFSFPTDTTASAMTSLQTFNSIGAQMGLPGIGPDDAWPLLKARLLNLFSGEDLRTPIEDFNMLVNVHIRRCIQRKSPIVLIEDVRELLQTGFVSLSQTLRGVPDDRLVLKLVEMWISVYGTVLPFLQAVFLPLDLEFKGTGTIMSAREAQEFWGAMPQSLKSDERPSSAGGTIRMPSLGEELDVRRLTLISFRDTVILPRHEPLMATFSRLSLDSINAGASPDPAAEGRKHARSDPATTGAERPGTAGSLSPHLSSFNSQGSTLLDAASSSSGGALSLASRSRATSNTSAGSFGTSMPHLGSPISAGPGSFSATNQPVSPPAAFTDPAKVTETVARMLQCLYVLASCQTGDVGQGIVERLTGALKYNWLGRGRTGRDRRGFVGMRSPIAQRVGLVGA